MQYRRLAIEIESPEERGYDTIQNNLTESSVSDVRLGDLGLSIDDLVLAYGDHRGAPRLRELIAAETGEVGSDHVMTTPGAAAALFMVATTLLERGDHAVVQHTNYSTNLETPRLIGAEIDTLPVRFDDGWAFDVERLESLVRPGDTKLISLTVPHNPTGSMVSADELAAVVRVAEQTGAWLLVDETYRGLTHGAVLPSVAELSDRAVSVSSLSKSFGLPGIRLGWTATRNPELAERLLAAKEQVVICTSALDEAVAEHVLEQRERFAAPIRTMVAEHLEIVADWFDTETLVEWIRPTGGVVCFPRLVEGVDPDRFYATLNGAGTFVGEGHWFDTSRRYFRLGFGWPTTDELRAGLAGITAAAAASVT